MALNLDESRYAEAGVVRQLRSHLLLNGLLDRSAGDIVVDSDPSYLRAPFRNELRPFGRFDINGGRPDLVVLLEGTPAPFVAAFEVKASIADSDKGISQARSYRSGAHYSLLAFPAGGERIPRDLESHARQVGVGILVRTSERWVMAVPPDEPRPHPSVLGSTRALLSGAAFISSPQLNQPINFLAAVWATAARDRGQGQLDDVLVRVRPSLLSARVREHAVRGAMSIGMLDRDGTLTSDGAAIVEVLKFLDFPAVAPTLPRAARLAEFLPAIGAVLRLVLLRQPSVQLIVEGLRAGGGALRIDDLVREAMRVDPVLARNVFLSDPESDLLPSSSPEVKVSTAFKLKQNLWHVGILASKAVPGASRGHAGYRLEDDLWALEPALVRVSR